MPLIAEAPPLARGRSLAAALIALVAVVPALGLAAFVLLRPGPSPPSSWPSPDELAAAPTIAFGVRTGNAPGDAVELSRFAQLVQHRPTIVAWSQSFAEPLFYPVQMRVVSRTRQTPMISWSPWDGDPAHVRDYAPRLVASGRYDRYLRRAARLAAADGRPLFIRFAHEMNGSWYPWGVGVSGTTPSEFIAMWRHVVDVFRANGATNVRWVWSPNTMGHGVPEFNNLYPGDRYVDWVGIDGYNWGAVKQSGWRTFGSVFGRSYDVLTRITDKPVMLAEVGSAEAGGSKAAWIRDGLGPNLPARFPRVRAVVWFNVDRETDWRVNSTPDALSAFRTVLSAPFWRGGG